MSSTPQKPEEKRSLFSYARRGIRTALELVPILLSTYLVVHVLKEYGVVQILDRYLTPVLRLVGLRGELSIPLLSGYLGNIYFALGPAGALQLTTKEATILAVMLGLCHSLIIEAAILQKAGVSALRVTAWRLVISLGAGALLNVIWSGGAVTSWLPEQALLAGGPAVRLLPVLLMGIWKAFLFSLKIAAIVVTIVTLMEMARGLGWIDRFAKACRPISGLLGISEEAIVPLMIGLMFGLTFGAAIIIEEARRGIIARRDMFLVGIFLGLCHSVPEDTVIFIGIGANPAIQLALRLSLAFALTFALGRGAALLARVRPSKRKEPETASPN